MRRFIEAARRTGLMLATSVVATVSASGSLGCATTPLVRAARAGQLNGLRETLATGVANGTLREGEATDIARAIAKGEIERAKGDEGLQRFEDLRRCAREVDGELGSRASKRDALGAAAALMLVEEDVTSPGRYSSWAKKPIDDPEGAFRPLGARTLTSHGDGELRRKLILDPDGEVRRGALHAAADAGDVEDLELVLEAARVDPLPSARREAILTAGVIGGERAVTALRDLWPRADAEARAAIVTAWASDESYKHGGRERLVWVVETQHGVPALLAAAKLVDARDEAAVEATGAFERVITDGPTADRVKAIEEAPPRVDALRATIEKVEADTDEGVAAAAMKRRLAKVKDASARDALVAKLLVIATGSGGGAPTAREALALAGVREVAPVLEREGASTDPLARARAGATLAMLGDMPRAAVVAADPEPRVRTTVACEMLRAAHRGGGK